MAGEGVKSFLCLTRSISRNFSIFPKHQLSAVGTNGATGNGRNTNMSTPHIHKTVFTFRQKVRLIEIDAPAIINYIIIDQSDIQYKVSYWMNGEQKSVTVYEEELAEI